MEQRIALVTGGTGGIGTEICRQLHDDGYPVVAGYYSGGDHRKAEEWQAQQKADGYDIELAFGNIREWESSEACINSIRERFGTVDVLVNNGGQYMH